MEWIERQKRVFLHFTPTGASWLNLVERFFSTLTEKQIRRGVFHSVNQLEQYLKDYIETYNQDPRPSGLDETGRGAEGYREHQGFGGGDPNDRLLLVNCEDLGVSHPRRHAHKHRGQVGGTLDEEGARSEGLTISGGQLCNGWLD